MFYKETISVTYDVQFSNIKPSNIQGRLVTKKEISIWKYGWLWLFRFF